MSLDPNHLQNSGKHPSPREYDAIIVGAGMSGIGALYRLRKIGLRCLILEKKSDIGGVWLGNRYPGARIDTGIPSYLLDIPECWSTWTWSCDYPESVEIRRYINHCDQQISIRDHTLVSTGVKNAWFDETSCQWFTICDNDTVFKSKYFICAVGITSRRSQSLDAELAEFRGELYHPNDWPDGVSPEDKDGAIIGTGCTGVQIAESWAPRAKSLTVYQRTYNTALPQLRTKQESDELPREIKKEHLESRETTGSGVAFWRSRDKDTLDDTVDDREEFYRHLYEGSGLRFWLCGYRDLVSNPIANRLAYDFWAKVTRPRIQDPQKRDILAPVVPKYSFGTRRPAHEIEYFELFNRENVNVVDITADQI
ncbi:unnamed protein product [Penicillium salamii]|nr:unnamed protein product [Penicillium salamii]CAG8378252.1 unnamed protein product [Penicillium salamii]